MSAAEKINTLTENTYVKLGSAIAALACVWMVSGWAHDIKTGIDDLQSDMRTFTIELGNKRDKGPLDWRRDQVARYMTDVQEAINFSAKNNTELKLPDVWSDKYGIKE